MNNKNICYKNPNSNAHHFYYIGTRETLVNNDKNILTYMDFVCQFCGELNTTTQISDIDLSYTINQ